MGLASGIIQRNGANSKVAFVFGDTVNLPAAHAALAGLTMAEYFRDTDHQDSLLFLDNVHHLVNASSEVPAGFQERIGATVRGSITLVQSYRPSSNNDLNSIASSLGTKLVLSKQVAEKGIYPAIDPLASTSQMLDPSSVGPKHYHVARAVLDILQDYKALLDIIAILGFDELSLEDKLKVARARKVELFLSQPFYSAEAFSGQVGRRVDLQTTINDFAEILSGYCDDIPEVAFYMVGDLVEVREKAKNLAGNRLRRLRGSEIV